jgi:hypothetical protein
MLKRLLDRWRTKRPRGYLFVARADEIAAMDMAVGPTRPMSPGPRGKKAVPLRDLVRVPYVYAPALLDLMVRVVREQGSDETLQRVRTAGDVAVYRFPSGVTDTLSRLTPERTEETSHCYDDWAQQMVGEPEVPAHYTLGGLSSMVLFVRCHALKAVPRDGTRELYYWFSTG